MFQSHSVNIRIPSLGGNAKTKKKVFSCMYVKYEIKGPLQGFYKCINIFQF